MILVGAGGHALSLTEFARDMIEGYVAFEENPQMNAGWLGDDTVVKELARNGHRFHIAFVYSGLPVMEKRQSLIERYKNLGAEMESLIAPTAIITPNSKIGAGSAIMQGAIINRAEIGENCVVNSGAIVEHDCSVGSNTFIGPGAVIGGYTSIGNNCFIGLGARISNGIKIADNISVAMGAIVARDLTEPGIYHGNPLRLFKLRRK